MAEILSYEMPKRDNAIIKVIGVGGGGSNAVNYMYKQGIAGVDFVICNTDNQALDASPIPSKIKLGETLTEGMGAGSLPAVGRDAAIETLPLIEDSLAGKTKMVFITAGMGGGTGTGAAPIIAKAARDKGLLTVGIVTIPFMFEGQSRIDKALDGVEALQEHVDALLVINNERLKDMFGNLQLSKAFSHADNVLATAAKGIAEIITIPGYVNVDFKDVRTVMRDSGVAIMGSGHAKGENRAIQAIEKAVNSPLLNDNDIRGARQMLLHIISGKDEITMDEVTQITNYLTERVQHDVAIIWGTGYNEELEDNIGVTIIATGFSFQKPGAKNVLAAQQQPVENKPTTVSLDDDDDDDDEPIIDEGIYSNAYNTPKEEPKHKEIAPGQTIEFDLPKASKKERFKQYYSEPKKEEPKDEAFPKHNIEMPEYNVNFGNVNNLQAEQFEDEKYIDQLESTPAYARKKQSVRSEPEEPEISEFSLRNKNGEYTLKKNNGFLDENPD